MPQPRRQPKRPSTPAPEQHIAWRPILAGLLAFGVVLVGVWALGWHLIARHLNPSPVQTEIPSESTTAPTAPPTGVSPIELQASAQRVLLDPSAQARSNLLSLAPEELARPTRAYCAAPFIYFLARGQLYRADISSLLNTTRTAQPRLLAEPLMPNREHRLSDGTPIQALKDLTPLDHEHLLLLDQANQVFLFHQQQGTWQHLPEAPVSLPGAIGPSEAHPVALASWQGRSYLLDDLGNQIWRYADGSFSAYFDKQARLLQNAIDLHVDGDVYVLRRNGEIWRYANGQQDAQALFRLKDAPLPHPQRPLSPRALRGDAHHLYLVDAGQRRILQLSKASGQLQREWVLTGAASEWERLNDLIICHSQSAQQVALAGNELILLPQQHSLKTAILPPSPPLPPLLQGLIHPIPGVTVADHRAVFPGARRLERFGVHRGLDIFDPHLPQEGGKQIRHGTPVLAMADAEVLRVDQQYQEMKPTAYEALLDATRSQGETRPNQENSFRGRQVWLRHANGLVSIYSHLSQVPEGLREGQQVVQGQVIGQVGNSGTRAAVYSQPDGPHLHLELWLHDPDSAMGTYLGKDLHGEESMQLWQRILAEETQALQ